MDAILQEVTAGSVEDLLTLLAIPWSRLAVRPHHIGLNGDLLGLAVTPAQKPELPFALSGFGVRQSLAESFARVELKVAFTYTKDDITNLQNTFSR